MLNSEPHALLELLSFCFPQKDKKAGQLELQPTLNLLKTADLNHHDKLLPAVEQQLETLETLSPPIYAQLRYCDQLFINYCQGHKLDPAINQALLYLLPLINCNPLSGAGSNTLLSTC